MSFRNSGANHNSTAFPLVHAKRLAARSFATDPLLLALAHLELQCRYNAMIIVISQTELY